LPPSAAVEVDILGMSKKLKAAVIGCGNIGASVKNYGRAVRPGSHASAYQANAKTKLAALVENDKDKWPGLKNDFPRVKIYEDADLMFKEIKPDIVSIATPTGSHYKFVLMAAKYKCPAILCEKPISYSVQEAKKMILACQKSNSQLFINHTRHFDPLLQKWSRKVRNGFLGQIYQGNAYYYNGLFNNGTHLIDLLRMFLGEIDWVAVQYNKKTSWQEKDLNVDGLIAFKNGALISFQSLSKNYGYFGFSLFGEKRMINVTNLAYEIEYRKKIRNENYKGFFELSSEISKEGAPRSFMKSAIGHVVSCLEGKTAPQSTGQNGLAVLEILMTLASSAQQHGKKLYLKKKNE